MILFSGGADSLIRRWEPASRMNPYIYSQTEALAGPHGRGALRAVLRGGRHVRDGRRRRDDPAVADSPTSSLMPESDSL